MQDVVEVTLTNTVGDMDDEVYIAGKLKDVKEVLQMIIDNKKLIGHNVTVVTNGAKLESIKEIDKIMRTVPRQL